MSLPLYRWLSRPLARLLRCTWMSRFLIGPAGTGDTAWFGQGKKARPKADTRLSLQQLETRFVPQDMLGVLHTGMSIAGAPVLMGTIPSPGQVFLDGWVDHNKPAVLPADFSTSVNTAAQPALPEAAPGQLEALASLALNESSDAGGGACPPEVQPAAAIEPVAQTQQGDFSLKPWLDDVGEFLNSPPAHESMPANTEPSGTSGGGGGGGGGSGAPGSGVNSGQPAAPLASAASAPDARSAAQMTQPAVAPALMTSSGATAAANPAATGNGGGSQGSHAATPDDQGGSSSGSQGGSSQSSSSQPALASSFGQVPLPFEMNQGQASNSAVLAQSNGPGFGFWLTNESMVFSVPHLDAQSGQPDGSDVFTLAMANVNSGAQVAPADLLSSRSNYFTSADSSGWHTDVPQYGQINDNNVWQGVNLELHAASAGSRIFEYDFTVQPGADVSSIQLDPQGLQGVQLDDQGRLLLGTSGGNVVMDAPVLYQNIGGQTVDVASGYVINQDGSIGFQVTGQYDTSQPLVIDPTLSYASLLGGSLDDNAYGIAVNANGTTTLVSQTVSSNFPVVNGYQSTTGATFIAKLNAQGTGLIYSTYLGDNSTKAVAVAVDPAGAAYVVGRTDSGLPTTAGAYDTSFPGSMFAGFITKLNETGDALAYSSYFGDDTVNINAVAVDALGQAHIAGTINAGMGGGGSLPTTGGVVQTTFGGMRDAFATEFNSAGSSLVYSTYLGGSNQDLSNGIALDSSDNAYIVGTTYSSNYPTTAGAYQTSLGGLSSTNVFVTKLNSTATSRVYSTYIGSSTNTGTAIAVDRSGQAYVTGAVGSHVLIDALNAAGSTLVYATTLSGNGTDSPGGIAVTGSGNASVVGSTTSTNLSTTTGALQSSLQGTQSAFVLQLTPSATVSYLSYLGGSTTSGGGFGGGSATTSGVGVALGPTGIAYVAGTTNRNNFPTSSGAYSTSNAGGNDAFVAEFLPGLAPPLITAISSDTGSSSTDHITSTQNLSISGTATPSTTITLERADLGVLGTAAVSAGGTWTYNYTGTTLTDDTYDFFARDVNGSGAKSGYSNDFLVTVDDTAPAVTLSVPATTTTLAPMVSVVAKDLVGMPATTTVTLDLSSTSSSGPWTSGYASATMTGGEAQLTLPALAGTGTYWLRARADDLAGNQGTSAVASFTVNSATSWSGSAQALSADPEEGDLQMQMGAVQFSHSLDLDQSPGIDQGGDPALVYNSGEVSQKPIIQVQLNSPNNASLPAMITAQLTFNGTMGFMQSYNTTGFNKGDTLTMALQASSAITTTGGYSWSLSVTAGTFTHTYTGYTFVVAQDSSPLGAGWSFAGVNQLVSISASGSVPAGMLMVYGSGGYRFYQGTSSFTSPTGDNGTLTLSGGTYTYSTPDGESWTYNSSGLMTQWTSPDGNETLQYRCDGSNRLDGITAIDGAVSTFTYTGSTSVAIQTVNSRTTTLTLSSGNLAEITNADGGVQTLSYDANHRLTEEQLGITENAWGYTSAGVLATMTQGGTMGIGSSPTNTVFDPALTQGLSALIAGPVQALSTNADGASVIEQLDSQGRPLSETAGDGGTTTMTYSNGFLTGETDPLGRTTTYSLTLRAHATPKVAWGSAVSSCSVDR